MNKISVLGLAGLGLVSAGAMSLAPLASAEVELSASAGVANMYLWRGMDLGNGSAQVSGDLTASIAGAYGGVWVSSGDSATGTEYDVYLGYGGEAGDFSYDISVWSYVYPSTTPSDLDKVGDLSEVILTLGYGAFSFSYYDNVAGATSYEYYTFSGEMDDFSATLGLHDPDEADGQTFDDDVVHLDLSYAYNENLSFTASQVVSADEELMLDENVLFVVSYSLDIK